MTRDEKTVAIVQSCYIPWKGYFDLINLADEFILFDDRQFTKRDWRNRNLIKTPTGTRWLSIPVQVKGRYLQRIDETFVDGSGWRKRHWETIRHQYMTARYFGQFAEQVQELYLGDTGELRLSAINRAFIELICEFLGVTTTLSWSTDYEPVGERTERLVSLCVQSGATTYLSGPSARAYLEEDRFRAEGIEILYMSYDGYPEYEQPYPPFDHAVSILDLLFCTGSKAPSYMKSFAHG
jgi:WbqC-like protein family